MPAHFPHRAVAAKASGSRARYRSRGITIRSTPHRPDPVLQNSFSCSHPFIMLRAAVQRDHVKSHFVKPENLATELFGECLSVLRAGKSSERWTHCAKLLAAKNIVGGFGID